MADTKAQGTEQPLLETSPSDDGYAPDPTRKMLFGVFAILWAGGVLTYSVMRIVDADSVAQGFRIAMITMFALVTLLYLMASFVDNSMFVGDLCVAPNPNSTPAQTWSQMSPDARHAAMSSGGWFTAVNLVGYAMMVYEPGCEASLCKCYFSIMVMWQFFWYGAFLGHVDYNSAVKKTAMDFFKKETIQEIVLGSAFFYLGFIASKDAK